MKRVLLYFRKDLRLHDNPTLLEALKLNPDSLIPVFILDSHYVMHARCGVNRWRFLLGSLKDLDDSLRKLGSRLLVLRGDPMKVLPLLYSHWGISHVFHEIDTEHFWQIRDKKIKEFSAAQSVSVVGVHGHTLYDPIEVVKANGGKPPLSFNGFVKAISKLQKPPSPLAAPEKVPALGDISLLPKTTQDYPIDNFTRPTFDPIDKETRKKLFASLAGPNGDFDTPTLAELGFKEPEEDSKYKGGESVALKQMKEFFKDKARVAKFEKPLTNPAAFQPAATTVLSPHFKFGTLSCRLFYETLMSVYQEVKKHSEPPVSLLGQLYWREFYYAVNSVTPDYHKMVGNPVCLQIPWWCQDGPSDPDNPKATENLKAWTHGKTGYPWIDAIMNQLRREGWIHHLARHAVACFLTRGDLFISWERGAEVFEEYLLDHDSPINIGNWLWLSSSAFFTSYFRVYSPVAFGKKNDPKGLYIKKYVPELKDFPLQYLFEPWKAPKAVQEKAKCILGKDYPFPIVDHDVVLKENMEKMKQAYAKGEKGQVRDGAFYGPLAAPFIHNSKNKKIKV